MPKVTSVSPAQPAEVYDLSVCVTHNFAVEGGSVVHNCFGKTCGVCDAEDLKIRRNYVQAAADEIHVDLSKVKVIDQKSTVMKVRARVTKGVQKRMVMNDHFRYAVRRAANRAGMPIAKRTVKFATENLKHKDWTCGTDFVEFATTKKLSQAQVASYFEAMNAELKGTSEEASLRLEDFVILPAKSDPMRSDLDLSLFEMELDRSPDELLHRIAWWDSQDYVEVVIREDGYMGEQATAVNAKEHVDDMWVVRDGHRVALRMTLRGKLNPYLVAAALFEKKSWIAFAQYPAVRLDAFVESDDDVVDFFRPSCVSCERLIPVNLLDRPYDPERCPRCSDEAAGRLVEGART